MSHLFIFLLRISTVQRVYSEEINVTVLRKGKSKHLCVSHQSSVSACLPVIQARGGGGKNVRWFFKGYLKG